MDYIVCMPLNLLTPITRVAGCTEDVCVRCGAKVAVSISAQKFLERHPHRRVLCLLCLPDEADHTVKVGAVPGSIEEALAHLTSPERN